LHHTGGSFRLPRFAGGSTGSAPDAGPAATVASRGHGLPPTGAWLGKRNKILLLRVFFWLFVWFLFVVFLWFFSHTYSLGFVAIVVCRAAAQPKPHRIDSPDFSVPVRARARGECGASHRECRRLRRGFSKGFQNQSV